MLENFTFSHIPEENKRLLLLEQFVALGEGQNVEDFLQRTKLSELSLRTFRRMPQLRSSDWVWIEPGHILPVRSVTVAKSRR